MIGHVSPVVAHRQSVVTGRIFSQYFDWQNWSSLRDSDVQSAIQLIQVKPKFDFRLLR